MESFVYKRRIVFGGAASAAVLAASILAAGPALASTGTSGVLAAPAMVKSTVPGWSLANVPGVAKDVVTVPALGTASRLPASALPALDSQAGRLASSSLPVIGSAATGVPAAGEAEGALTGVEGMNSTGGDVTDLGNAADSLPNLSDAGGAAGDAAGAAGDAVGDAGADGQQADGMAGQSGSDASGGQQDGDQQGGDQPGSGLVGGLDNPGGLTDFNDGNGVLPELSNGSAQTSDTATPSQPLGNSGLLGGLTSAVPVLGALGSALGDTGGQPDTSQAPAQQSGDDGSPAS
jgi:hypothetical protein